MFKRVLSVVMVVAALPLAGCEVQKSANPLSPSVAGPIPGVDITTPRLTLPAPGARIPMDQQPLTLAIDNASTSGVRPILYRLEVASDASFGTKVFTAEGVAPGADGKTLFRLSEPLIAERTYYWHARAEDGANIGEYSPTIAFEIFTPAVLLPPVLVSPLGGVQTTSLTPTLTFQNSVRSGPVGPVLYLVVVTPDPSFQSPDLSYWWVPELPGATTSFVVPDSTLGGGKLYYWAVLSSDGKVGGLYSSPGAFSTPPVVSQPTPSAPGGSGGAGGVNFDSLGSVRIVGGSPDVRDWAVTSRITSLRFSPDNIHLEHTKTGQWPGVDIGGALQEMTLWVFFKINGQWYGTGGERWRPGQTDKALSAPSAIGPGWFYNDNWAPMTNYVPRPGELVGFMVVAGSTRIDASAPVKERSDVLLIPFPADGVVASFP